MNLILIPIGTHETSVDKTVNLDNMNYAEALDEDSSRTNIIFNDGSNIEADIPYANFNRAMGVVTPNFDFAGNDLGEGEGL